VLCEQYPEEQRYQADLDDYKTAIGSGEIVNAQARSELLEAITVILDADRAADDLRADVTAEDVSASLLGIYTVVGRAGRHAQAGRLLDLLMEA